MQYSNKNGQHILALNYFTHMYIENPLVKKLNKAFGIAHQGTISSKF